MAATYPPDIVFTTYQTVELEWRKRRLERYSIFSFHWKRIVLDEGKIRQFTKVVKKTDDVAHVIRNQRIATARAVTALRAEHRWTISGTPIQNTLIDFVGLFKFLHFHPYDELRKFDEDFSEPLRNQNVQESVQRLKKLLSCVMIRRSKRSTIELPPRCDQIIRIPFDSDERAHYNTIERPVVAMLDDTTTNSHDTSSLWFSAIQQLHKLRIICKLGVYAASSRPSPPQSKSMGSDASFGILATRLSIGAISCEQCLHVVDLPEARAHSERPDTATTACYSSCLRLFCTDCADLLHFKTPAPCICGTTTAPCTLQPLYSAQCLQGSDLSESSASPDPYPDEVVPFSSKVKQLVSEIRGNSTEKR